MTLSRIGRLWQYAGIAILSYAATKHATILGNPDPAVHSEGGVEIPASWIHFLIGVCIGVVVFWTGIYLESKGKQQPK